MADAIELPAPLVGILIAASFDGAVAAINRGARAAALEIHEACRSASQAVADQRQPFADRHRLAADTRVVVCNSDDGSDHETTWGAFCADNADGLDLPQIVSTLARGATFTGGGGAEGSWTLRKA